MSIIDVWNLNEVTDTSKCIIRARKIMILIQSLLNCVHIGPTKNKIILALLMAFRFFAPGTIVVQLADAYTCHASSTRIFTGSFIPDIHYRQKNMEYFSFKRFVFILCGV